MIRNEVQEPDRKSFKNKKDNDEEKRAPLKTATDIQRLKLEKLMKNPDKLVIIPERPKEKGLGSAPDFVRNVMGSSAGAGSGEFHVYRHLRRKEYARQKYIQAKSKKELLDEEYHKKLEEHKRLADEITAKKRAKRLKKKQKMKNKPKKPKLDNDATKNSEESEEESDDDAEKEESEETNQTDDKPEDDKDKTEEMNEDNITENKPQDKDENDDKPEDSAQSETT